MSGPNGRIARLEAIPYRLPLSGALRWGGYGHLADAEHVLVRVHLEGGVVGQAEAPPRPTIYGETVGSVLAILDHLAPVLVGLEIEDEPGIERALGSVANNHTARGALDTACWDARARAAGEDLFQHLAGPNRRLAVSYILGLADHEVTLAEARRVVEAGVRVLKVKIGRDEVGDLERIAALRAELGPEVVLYADGNEALTPQAAPEALEALREAGIAWIEEPLPVHLLRERAALRRLAILPIIADDSCFTLSDLERELAFDTFDILNVKPARTGVTGSLRMLGAARANGKGVMVGSQASTTLGTIHAALTASQAAVAYPSELSFFLRLEAEIVNRRPRLHKGVLDIEELRDIEVDEAALERHRV